MQREPTTTRRKALTIGATAFLTGAAGCAELFEPRETPTPETREPTTGPSGPPPTPPTIPRYADRFSNTIDVASVGADPTGERPINDVLSDAMGDDTLLYLPEGRYLMEEPLAFREFTNLGIVGEGATIVPPENYSSVLFAIGQPGHARGFVFDGITFDFRAEETGARPLLVKVDDGLVVRDVTVVGTQDVDSQMMRFDVTSASGSGLIERMQLPHGAVAGTVSTGCLVGSSNEGDLTFRDCHIAGFPDNGLYAEPPAGRISVIGGRYENNNVANVRVGGGGIVRGVHVRCDSSPEEFNNMRGIRLTEGGGTVVEDCLVEFLEVTGSDGAITLSTEMDAATIRNTEIRIDTGNVAAILAKEPAEVHENQGIRCENVTIRGGASDTSAIRVENRNDCVFEGMTIEQTGENRDGIELVDSVGNLVRDTRIDVTDDPIVLINAETRTVNVLANDVPLTDV